MRSFIFLVLSLTSSYGFCGETFLAIGYGKGGEDISKFAARPTGKISSGDGLQLFIGYILPVIRADRRQFELQMNAGFLVSGNDFDREDSSKARWQRTPLEILYVYHNTREQFRFGYGASFHILNHVNEQATYSDVTFDVDNATGVTIIAEKIFGDPEIQRDHFSIGIKYTNIQYHSSQFNTSVDGSSIALNFAYYIPSTERSMHHPPQ